MANDNNPIQIVTADDIRDEMMLAFQFTHYREPEGKPSPFHENFCSRCFGIIAHAIGTGDYRPVITQMGDPLIDHLLDFFASKEDYERCTLLKQQREEVMNSTLPGKLALTRAWYAEVILAKKHQFDIANPYCRELEDWLEAKAKVTSEKSPIDAIITWFQDDQQPDMNPLIVGREKLAGALMEKDVATADAKTLAYEAMCIIEPGLDTLRREVLARNEDAKTSEIWWADVYADIKPALNNVVGVYCNTKALMSGRCWDTAIAYLESIATNMK